MSSINDIVFSVFFIFTTFKRFFLGKSEELIFLRKSRRILILLLYPEKIFHSYKVHLYAYILLTLILQYFE